MYKVFLVDDEKYILKSLRSSIDWQAQGFEIIGEGSSSAQAYADILETLPDLVLTDIRMPGMNGLELIQRVGEAQPHILFIAISGYAEFTYVQKAMNYGAITYCLKPFDTQELENALAKAARMIAERRDLLDLRNAAAQNKAPEVRNDTVRKILELIHQDPAVNYSIYELADRFALNHNYLSQVFKKQTGKTYTDYVTEMRLAKSCALLKTTNLPISRVADRSGYEDYFYFAKVFKKHINMSPSEYRARAALNDNEKKNEEE